MQRGDGWCCADYCHVIAWAIQDNAIPIVAKGFYRRDCCGIFFMRISIEHGDVGGDGIEVFAHDCEFFQLLMP